MTLVRAWFESLDTDASKLVRDLVGVETPSDPQLLEVIELAEGYAIDAMGIEAGSRTTLEGAIADLEKRVHQADPRHRFLRTYDDIEISVRLVRFYETAEHAKYQHSALRDTKYAPYPLFVDFDAIGMLMNPDFTAETIGAQFIEFADLKESPDQDPGECYAHLAIDPETTTVYLMEPSGEPERIGDDLDAFLERLS